MAKSYRHVDKKYSFFESYCEVCKCAVDVIFIVLLGNRHLWCAIEVDDLYN